MAKKFGSFVFLAALTGAVAGVISYLYKYQKFSDAVDQDFTDVVDSAIEVKDSAKRSYTILKDSRTKEDFKNLAIDTKNLALDAGKDAYKAVREVLDKKKTELLHEEEDDVDVEFYYDDADEVVDGSAESTINNDDAVAEEKKKDEHSGLVVTEEV